MNSSPPKRATTSVPRSAPMMRAATVRSSASPTDVAERIVDALEVVEVDEQQRERWLAARAPRASSARAAP